MNTASAVTDKATLGELLSEWQGRAKKTWQAIADECGVHIDTLMKIRSGINLPRSDILIRAMLAMKIPVAELKRWDVPAAVGNKRTR